MNVTLVAARSWVGERNIIRLSKHRFFASIVEGCCQSELHINFVSANCLDGGAEPQSCPRCTRRRARAFRDGKGRFAILRILGLVQSCPGKKYAAEKHDASRPCLTLRPSANRSFRIVFLLPLRLTVLCGTSVGRNQIGMTMGGTQCPWIARMWHIVMVTGQQTSQQALLVHHFRSSIR